MKPYIETVIDRILHVEGGYVDHPDDKGGPTNHGITEAVARSYGWHGDMAELPVAMARDIYRMRYYLTPKFDMVVAQNKDVGEELIDTGVNMGPARAALFLQRCLNVFNMKGSRYPDLFMDGRIGPVTISALDAFLRWRGQQGVQVLLRALNSVQGTRYIEIAENDPDQESFTYGWFATRVSMEPSE